MERFNITKLSKNLKESEIYNTLYQKEENDSLEETNQRGIKKIHHKRIIKLYKRFKWSELSK